MNLASMFIVVPMLTNNKIIFGVYSVCISTAIFLSYADLGFVTAGIKYAAECFARGEIKQEIRLHGFSSFILLIFVTLIVLLYLIFSFYPSILIKNIGSSGYLVLASKLLLVQAIFSYTTVLQRVVSGVFMVRIEQYINQRITVTGAFVKIISVFYFFSANKYDILHYFLFIKIVDLFVAFIGIIVIRRRYNFPIINYLKSIKFDQRIFNETKGLAFSSIFATFMWILYYELDLIAIGYFLGSLAVAVFALAFTFIKFLRTLISIIFGPFVSRYNHYFGLNNINELKGFVYKIILLSMPIIILTDISVIFLSKYIVLTWAGSEYLQSGLLLRMLAIGFIYSFIEIPASNMLVTLKRLKEIYLISFIMVVVFWAGVFFTKGFWGVNSFAIFKVVASTLSVFFYLNFLLRFLGIRLVDFMKNTVVKMIFPVIIQILFLLLLINYLPETKGTVNLLLVICIGLIGVLVGFIALYFTSSYYKLHFNKYFNKIAIRNN